MYIFLKSEFYKKIIKSFFLYIKYAQLLLVLLFYIKIFCSKFIFFMKYFSVLQFKIYKLFSL